MWCLRDMAKALCGLQMGGAWEGPGLVTTAHSEEPLGSPWAPAARQEKPQWREAAGGPSPARSMWLDTGWPAAAPKREMGEWLSSTQLCPVSFLHRQSLPDPDVQLICHPDIGRFPLNTLGTLNSSNSSPFSKLFLLLVPCSPRCTPITHPPPEPGL